MSLCLTTRDLQQIQGALRTLASPQSFPSLTSWRTEAGRCISTLLGADTATTVMLFPGEPQVLCNRPIAMDQYGEHFQALDPGPLYRKTEALSWSTLRPRYELPDASAWRRSEFYNDWVRAQRLQQPSGMSVVRTASELSGSQLARWAGLAGLYCYRDAESPELDNERALAILGLLLPAFVAGLTIMAHARQHERERVALLGALSDGAFLVQDGGQVCYENPALGRHLAGDPEFARVRHAGVLMARAALGIATRDATKAHPADPTAPFARDVTTATGSYRLSVTITGVEGDGPPLAVILVQRRGGPPLEAGLVAQRLELTRREAEVACLMAEGHSNRAIAGHMGIALPTARRHVEHVMMKLGVHTRGEAAAKVRRMGQ